MVGVITAVTSERDAILQKMTDIQKQVIYGIEFYKGKVNGKPCITAMSGIGKVNAARCTQVMIDRFKPDYIINIGSAGGLHPELKIGDVVISTACIQYDVDLTAFGIAKGAFEEGDDGFIKADPQLAAQCEAAMERCVAGQYKVLMGPIATGDQFNDSPTVKEELYREFGAYCNEMEGAAVAAVCAACQVPFVVIRSISDNSDEDGLTMYENFKRLAAERCVHFFINLLDELGGVNE
ncbi:MAG TPA: 5'-methylthioadenosine/adenosylhomocysteine nucleosidase [Bacillota bacterium]|nr:5'-methylthioadenosine/adenosylhomocysteine nucleosidase [Bacillota bacterium]